MSFLTDFKNTEMRLTGERLNKGFKRSTTYNRLRRVGWKTSSYSENLIEGVFPRKTRRRSD